MEVNYKKDKRYNTAKLPIRQPWYLTWLIWILSKMMLINKKHKVEKINMEGLKPPYILLSNHMAFIDFELVALGTHPKKVNNVVNIDGYHNRPWLMEWIGAICTRKFTNDHHLIKSIKKVLERGDILCMYPEARYTPCGTSSYLPESLGMLVKSCRVPLVVALHRGNHLHSPFWNVKNKRKVPLHTTLTKLLTVEEIDTLSVEEINAKIKEAMTYDDYAYQKENNILIKEKRRAKGLHKVLYQCPSCKTEFKMDSQGEEIFCRECGKHWRLNEDGTLSALEGETEFSHVPDWFNWEREQVEKEVQEGRYYFEDTVDVYSQPGCWKFEPLGQAKLTHDPENGFIIEGFYNGAEYRVQRKPLQINSLHVEYDFPHIKPVRQCFDISTESDSFYCYPKSYENIVTKLAFATEAIYQHRYNTLRNRRTKKEV